MYIGTLTLIISSIILIPMFIFYMFDVYSLNNVFIRLFKSLLISIVCTVPISIVIFFVIFIVTIIAGIGKDTVESRSDIVALSNGSEISGSFFLGMGTGDEQQVYTYMVEQADGGLNLKSTDADYATLYTLQDGEQPHIINSNTCYSGFSKNDFCFSDFDTKIYIPEGSILVGYEVDVRK